MSDFIELVSILISKSILKPMKHGKISGMRLTEQDMLFSNV
jgi:hypothetical protein